MMLRRQVRQQAKNLVYMFKIADADGSGELDSIELRAALYKASGRDTAANAADTLFPFPIVKHPVKSERGYAAC